MKYFAQFFAIWVLLIVGGAAAQAQDLRVEGAGVEADPTNYSGECPGVVKFSAKIQASGKGRVKYTWLRSDGATAPVEYLDFEGPGVKYVTTTWTLGDARALPNYAGWQQVKILSPNEMFSNKGTFKLNCKQNSAEKFAVTAAGLKAGEPRASGKCPVLVTFSGYITANGPGTVKYTFGRSDGATAPVYTLEFTEAGFKPVATTWTLGGAGLTGYEGWQTIKILSPNEFESDRNLGSFTMKCEP